MYHDGHGPMGGAVVDRLEVRSWSDGRYGHGPISGAGIDRWEMRSWTDGSWGHDGWGGHGPMGGAVMY